MSFSRDSATAILAALLTLTACGGSTRYHIGSLADAGFRHQRYDYEVAYMPGTRHLLGSEWRLDNYAPGENGGLGNPKSGHEYTYVFLVDWNDDGRDDGRYRGYVYDLLFENRSDDGAIWLRTVPLSGRDWDRQLRVIARNYVERASGQGSLSVRYEEGVATEARRFASRVITERALEVDGRDAYEVIFEIANVEQLELDDAARWMRGRIVFIRSEFGWSDQLERRSVTRERPSGLPVMMIAGYVNSPDDYDAGAPAFEDFLSRIRFSDSGRLLRRANAVRRCAPSEDVLHITAIAPKQQTTSIPASPFVHSSARTEEASTCIQEIVDRALRDADPARSYGARIVRPGYVPPEATPAPSEATPPIEPAPQAAPEAAVGSDAGSSGASPEATTTPAP